METVKIEALDWSVAGSMLPGQFHSGDQHVVCSSRDGVLIAVLDGLGHGEEAAIAARKAVDVLEHSTELPVPGLVQRCHEELKTTRGVVMSVASFAISDGTMTWMGVGNVQGVFHRANSLTLNSQEMLLLRSGVVGVHLPSLAAESLPVFPGDIVIFATDGIRSDFAQAPLKANTLQEAARNILARFSKGNDDALVLVARFLGNHT
jgi:phosphoserine phosphatase RsbX